MWAVVVLEYMQNKIPKCALFTSICDTSWDIFKKRPATFYIQEKVQRCGVHHMGFRIVCFSFGSLIKARKLKAILITLWHGIIY